MAKTTTPKTAHLTMISRKERLFNSFFRCAFNTMKRVENLFELDSAVEQVFGKDYSLFSQGEKEQAARSRIKQNRAWLSLSELYDYAVDGVELLEGSVTDGTSSLVIDAGEIIALLTGEEDGPDQEWHDIVRMGDGRFALGDGQPLDVLRVALLANVDVRTVRNAISAGALIAFKHGDDVLIENESARLWLMTRKGFKPTAEIGGAPRALARVSTPEEFGAFVRTQRSEQQSSASVLDAYPGLTESVLKEAEAGVFRAPLSLAWPLADFYGVSREEFLECVMRVFFPEALEALSDRIRREASASKQAGGAL